MDTKKASIQLSMGFVVMLTIAVVIFILSIVFLSDFFDQATTLRMNLDEQTRSQIESMLAGNARVAIPLESRQIRRGDSTSFGIGLRNTATREYFTIELGDASFIPTGSTNADDVQCQGGSCTLNGEEIANYQIGRNGKVQIPINQDDVVIIAFGTTRNTERGHYIFDVRICAEQGDYASTCTHGSFYDGNIHKVHLLVS